MSMAFSLAKLICSHCDQVRHPPAPIALFGQLSPNILAAILGVYLIPVFHRWVGVVTSLAYLPLGDDGSAEQWTQLQDNSVEIILVEESAIQVKLLLIE